MKKVLSALLAAAMILSLAACSGGTTTSSSSSSTASSDSSTESSTVSSESEATEDDPILTGEKPELKILSMYQAYNYEEQPTWKIDEELTGYKTKWYALPADNADQKLLLEISSGADYDILLRVSPSQYAQLSKQNALIDLSGMLDKYGSNITNAISELAWQSVTNDQGVVNGIPHENMLASKEEPYGMLTGGIGVRSDMLEELGMELPTNIDDFTAFLEAAKEKYGFAPLTSNKSSTFIQVLLSGFGMGEAEWYDIDGTYTHRIKHPQMFWDIPAMVNALATNNPDCKIEFVTDLAADANSKPTHYIMKGANFVSCISQSSKNPEHAINWLNILSEPDNYRRTYIGEEGVSYEVIDGNYTPIFTGDDATNFNAYTNSDKLSGINNPTVSFKMWQARARKTPEMAEAYEAMNARVDEYEPLISIELYGKTSPKVQEYVTALNQAFGDSFLKAIVEGTDPDTAIAAMQADWDANGGLEVEAAMQEFYDANKSYSE